MKAGQGQADRDVEHSRPPLAGAGPAARFGYFIPQFPGQTHSFFWREINSLKSMGQEPELVSTRRPVRGTVSHGWSATAMAGTHYLMPPTPRSVCQASVAVLRALRSGRRPVLAVGIRDYLAGACGRGPAGRIRGLLRAAVFLAAAGDLTAMARERGWTHVHVHSCADAAQIALFANFLSGLPYSLTLHGPLADYGPNQKQKWGHAAFGVVITERLGAELVASLPHDLPPCIEVAPMGVDLGTFDRSTDYVPWTGHGPARVFSCGRLNASKGHDDLIRAVSLAAESGVDIELVIAGEDEEGGRGYKQVLERLVAVEGIADRVRLIGAISEDQVRSQLESAHVFALASHAEPLGVAIMEAMALKIPVVVTRAGGVPELVDDGVSGMLVEPGDPGQLAAALAQLLGNPGKSMEMGVAGRARVADGFDSNRSAQVLARLIGGRQTKWESAP